jgi:hypothetical protein
MFSNFHKLPKNAGAVDKEKFCWSLRGPSNALVTRSALIIKSQQANDPLKAECVIKIESGRFFVLLAACVS